MQTPATVLTNVGKRKRGRGSRKEFTNRQNLTASAGLLEANMKFLSALWQMTELSHKHECFVKMQD